MALVGRPKAEDGIARTDKGWIALTRIVQADDSLGEVERKRRLIDGPFAGTGAKVRAIQAAGTNRVIA
jgi:hypothetical protein